LASEQLTAREEQSFSAKYAAAVFHGLARRIENDTSTVSSREEFQLTTTNDDAALPRKVTSSSMSRTTTEEPPSSVFAQHRRDEVSRFTEQNDPDGDAEGTPSFSTTEDPLCAPDTNPFADCLPSNTKQLKKFSKGTKQHISVCL
jgi:hypothetical protein